MRHNLILATCGFETSGEDAQTGDGLVGLLYVWNNVLGIELPARG